MKYLTVNDPDSMKEYEWVDLTGDDIDSGGGAKHLVYKTGANVKIINNRALPVKKLFVNGEKYDLSRDDVIIPDLKDENVYVEFNGPSFNTAGLFAQCSALKQIPEDLFAYFPSIKQFLTTFGGCTSLQSIPVSLFDNQRNITHVLSIFTGCSSLSGESPYTMVGGKKVHLYERRNYPEYFAEYPTSYMTHMQAFTGCTGLSDYAQIPTNWK